jgi:hypothetical protein
MFCSRDTAQLIGHSPPNTSGDCPIIADAGSMFLSSDARSTTNVDMTLRFQGSCSYR